MKLIDTWLYVKPAVMAAVEHDLPMVTGFWKPWAIEWQVYNVLGTYQEITTLVEDLEAIDSVSVARRFGWVWRDGHDDQEHATLETIPADILAVMSDHYEQDENGDIWSITPASYELPNWGHVFFGQGQRVFAGDFNNDFNEDFF